MFESVKRLFGRVNTTFSFHADGVFIEHCDAISFADDSADGQHYFVMSRSEDDPEQILPDVENVYIERDDQCWGGYGGIESVVLERDSLTVRVTPRMARQMGKHDVLRITFTLTDSRFSELRTNIEHILRGYDTLLKIFA
jgi:hypothetical protein